jgi:hypothetical protein
MNWKVLIVIGILLVVVLGFWFISGMTGGVVTGVDDEVVSGESFRISDFGDDRDEVNEEDLNGTQDSGGSG